MNAPTKPQVWTSEPLAVRALASLGVAHPREFSSALSTLTGQEFGHVVPDTIRCEDQYIDLRFSTRAGHKLFIEAKIDDFVCVEQISEYTKKAKDAIGIMLVPDPDAPDVQEVRAELPDLHAISWDDVLDPLARVNPIATQLRDDIRALSALPGTKARLRRLMRDARDGAMPVRGVHIEPDATANRYPCLNISVPGTFVFGQVEAGRDPNKEPSFFATIGFAVNDHDATAQDAKDQVRAALEQAWREAVELEKRDEVSLSWNKGRSSQQETYGMEQPYQARGYRESYVGVKTKTSKNPGEIVKWALSLAAEFEPVARSVWPEDGMCRGGGDG